MRSTLTLNLAHVDGSKTQSRTVCARSHPQTNTTTNRQLPTPIAKQSTSPRSRLSKCLSAQCSVQPLPMRALSPSLLAPPTPKSKSSAVSQHNPNSLIPAPETQWSDTQSRRISDQRTTSRLRGGRSPTSSQMVLRGTLSWDCQRGKFMCIC